ncbi:MAG: PilZ domain-containing protein [Methylococcaceae bacterium]
MKQERRSHARVKPENFKADISHHHSSEQEFDLSADIINISRTGIRIKLSESLDLSIHKNLRITMTLPDSGTPFTVHGILKHQHSENEYGVHYTDHVHGSIDDILFECVKLNDQTLLIKHYNPT